MAGEDQGEEGTVFLPRATARGTSGPLSGAPDAPPSQPWPGSQSAPRSGPFPSHPSHPSLTAVPPGPAEPVQVGDTLKDRFVLQQVLGSGGMGKVFLALDLRKQEAADRRPHVAVKVLKENFREHRDSIIAMQREARKAQELSHPNIVRVYDFDRDGTRFFIVMEYLTGRSLDQVLRDKSFKPMTPAEAAPVVAGIGAALAHAHANGFVHADLKPGNVFLTEGGKVKVIDFGLARAIARDTGDEDATAFDVGSLGAMTPAYASPEMLDQQPPTPRDDLFALACITYELLAGRHPFGRVPASHAREAGMKPPRAPGLTDAQWRALERGLAFDGAQRPAGVEAFLRELDLAGRGGVAAPAPVSLRPAGVAEPARSGPAGLWAALGLLVVAGAGGLAWLYAAEPPEQEAALGTPPAPAPVPAARDMPAVPLKPEAPAGPPGLDHAAALLGDWCGDAMRLRATGDRWAFLLPNGAEVPLGVEAYALDKDRLVLRGSRPGGKPILAEFVAPADGTLTHARVQLDGAAWREVGRVFRRC